MPKAMPPSTQSNSHAGQSQSSSALRKEFSSQVILDQPQAIGSWVGYCDIPSPSANGRTDRPRKRIRTESCSDTTSNPEDHITASVWALINYDGKLVFRTSSRSVSFRDVRIVLYMPATKVAIEEVVRAKLSNFETMVAKYKSGDILREEAELITWNMSAWDVASSHLASLDSRNEPLEQNDNKIWLAGKVELLKATLCRQEKDLCVIPTAVSRACSYASYCKSFHYKPLMLESDDIDDFIILFVQSFCIFTPQGVSFRPIYDSPDARLAKWEGYSMRPKQPNKKAVFDWEDVRRAAKVYPIAAAGTDYFPCEPITYEGTPPHCKDLIQWYGYPVISRHYDTVIKRIFGDRDIDPPKGCLPSCLPPVYKWEKNSLMQATLIRLRKEAETHGYENCNAITNVLIREMDRCRKAGDEVEFFRLVSEYHKARQAGELKVEI